MSLNKNLEETYEFYVQAFIKTIGDHHEHIPIDEMRAIWKNIKKPLKNNKKQQKQKKQEIESIIGNLMNCCENDLENRRNKIEYSLNNMCFNDLYRHCIHNGIQQPPSNKNDMIKIILTRLSR